MSGRDDHEDDMDPSARRDGDLDDALDALVSGRPAPAGLEEVADLLDDLRALGGSAAPAPTAALAQFLASPALLVGDAVSDLDARRQRRAVRAGAAALTVAVLTLGSVGVAAAQGRLPDRAQDAVASAVSALSPFTVPRAHRDPVAPEPEGRSPSPTPTPTGAAGVQGISRTAPQKVPAVGTDAAGTAAAVPSSGEDSPRSGPARRSDAGGSQEASAPPGEPQPAGTSPDGGTTSDLGGTSSSGEPGAGAQPSPSPTPVPGDATGADPTGSAPPGDGVDGADVSASPDS